MKTFEFRQKYHYSSIGSDSSLAPARRQAISLTNDGLCADAYMCRPQWIKIWPVIYKILMTDMMMIYYSLAQGASFIRLGELRK